MALGGLSGHSLHHRPFVFPGTLNTGMLALAQPHLLFLTLMALGGLSGHALHHRPMVSPGTLKTGRTTLRHWQVGRFRFIL